VSRFRKKPVVIEAMQFTEENVNAIDAWVADELGTDTSFGWQGDSHGGTVKLIIPTLEGDMRADVGDWIIRGVAGEFYPCKPDIFTATYEPCDGETAE
jgi:hypothetical protein